MFLGWKTFNIIKKDNSTQTDKSSYSNGNQDFSFINWKFFWVLYGKLFVWEFPRKTGKIIMTDNLFFTIFNQHNCSKVVVLTQEYTEQWTKQIVLVKTKHVIGNWYMVDVTF